MNQWVVGIVGIVAALALALGISWAGSDQGVRVGGLPLFLLCGIFAYLVQWLVFVHAWVKRTEVYFDLTGSATYVVMVLAALLLSGATDLRSLTLGALIFVWAARLGPFLFNRIRRAGEDRRFRTIKSSFPTFLMTWTLQGTWVFVTASCALAAITSGARVPVEGLYYLGIVIWLVGFAIEVIADRQKSAFRAQPENRDAFITSGLWAWSRHPNYFGEITLWVGIAVIAYPALQGWQLLTLVSPVFVVVLLTAISGVRMLEGRANKRWGEDPEYQAYRRDTPVLIPRPPRGGTGRAARD